MNLLTVPEVAERLNVSRHTVYKLKGAIGYVKVGGAVRFRPEDVEAYVAGNRRLDRADRAERVFLKPLTLRRA